MENRGCNSQNCAMAVLRHQEWKRQEIEAAKSDSHAGMGFGTFFLLVALAFLIPKGFWQANALGSGMCFFLSSMFWALAYSDWKRKKELQKS